MPKIVRFYETGPAEVLRLEDLPQRQPGKNEVGLKIEAVGLNRAEIMFRTGMYLETPAFPACLGLEAAGVVDAVGPGVTSLKNRRSSRHCSFLFDEFTWRLWRGGHRPGSRRGPLPGQPFGTTPNSGSFFQRGFIRI